MKVIKGGISREIDPARLQEYKDKGYVVVPENERPETPKPEKEKPKTPKKENERPKPPKKE
ncbi:hypothetical protein [Candidatus Darwinibacter acetoxidans]|jgi:hypothetical protein